MDSYQRRRHICSLGCLTESLGCCVMVVFLRLKVQRGLLRCDTGLTLCQLSSFFPFDCSSLRIRCSLQILAVTCPSLLGFRQISVGNVQGACCLLHMLNC